MFLKEKYALLGLGPDKIFRRKRSGGESICLPNHQDTPKEMEILTEASDKFLRPQVQNKAKSRTTSTTKLHVPDNHDQTPEVKVDIFGTQRSLYMVSGTRLLQINCIKLVLNSCTLTVQQAARAHQQTNYWSKLPSSNIPCSPRFYSHVFEKSTRRQSKHGIKPSPLPRTLINSTYTCTIENGKSQHLSAPPA